MGRINFDLQELQAFVAVAERASFRAAAEDLHLSQPALSRRVDKLEAQLGAKLLERTTRRVSHEYRTSLSRTRPDGHRRAGKRGAQHWRPGHATGGTDHRGLRALGGVLLPADHHSRVFAALSRIRVRIIDETPTRCSTASYRPCRFRHQLLRHPGTRRGLQGRAARRLRACRSTPPLSRRRSITWDELVLEQPRVPQPA